MITGEGGLNPWIAFSCKMTTSIAISLFMSKFGNFITYYYTKSLKLALKFEYFHEKYMLNLLPYCTIKCLLVVVVVVVVVVLEVVVVAVIVVVVEFIKVWYY